MKEVSHKQPTFRNIGSKTPPRAHLGLTQSSVINNAEKKLEFDKGDIVSVNGSEMSGVVKYVGSVHFSVGVWIGIELSTNIGRCDGSIQGKRFFTCSPNHGIFVRAASCKLVSKKTAPANCNSDGVFNFRSVKSPDRVILSPITDKENVMNETVSSVPPPAESFSIDAKTTIENKANDPSATSTMSSKEELLNITNCVLELQQEYMTMKKNVINIDKRLMSLESVTTDILANINTLNKTVDRLVINESSTDSGIEAKKMQKTLRKIEKLASFAQQVVVGALEIQNSNENNCSI